MMEPAAAFDLQQLPLILAGPILRRTEAYQVSVWVALQMPSTIRLQIFPANGDRVERGTPVIEGTASTISLGKSLHLALITAQTSATKSLNLAPPLVPGQLYAYDLRIHPRQNSEIYPKSELTFADDSDAISLTSALRSPMFPDVNISYFDHGLPTFSLPPENLHDLKILHGSCRKLHDKELDALPIIDQMIAESAASPNDRPHQLFFTGDQIYGDEVADAFLWAIQQLQPILFGWKEATLDEAPIAQYRQGKLKPGKRHRVAEDHAGLTASMQGDRQKTQSHLLWFSEYCTSYLFSWSECFWHWEFPSAQALGRKGKAAKHWNQQVQHLHDTAKSQVIVRRTLANIPTYMIFDDHDVSDDWNLNQDWCLRVLGKPLGRQVVRNALLSYALFQGWGNTPEQFLPNTIGADLLAATERWQLSQGMDEQALATIQQSIGMPMLDQATDLPKFQADGDTWILSRPACSLTWHYRIAGAAHEVIVLDTRTQRGYPIDQPPTAPPHLLSPTGFQQQIQAMLQADSTAKMTFIVAPTNVFTLGMIDNIQKLGHLLNKTYDFDIGDAWNLESNARLRLMQELFGKRQQIIILSGDIHFGGALRVDYWDHPQATAASFRNTQTPPDACLVQLVASAICNSEFLTEVLQTKIKLLLPERIRYWVGYQNEQKEIEVTPHFWQTISQTLSQLIHPKQRQRSRQSINWGYRSQWLQRQPTQLPAWTHTPNWLQQFQDSYQKINIFRKLWRWRWLQEGKEVVGLNNVGLVQLKASPEMATSSILVYDVYWYAPWSAPHVVYSRFETPLR